MSFKEKYGEYQQQIVPDEKFLEKLAVKMEQQKQKQLNRKKLYTIFISIASVSTGVAAALVLILNVPKALNNNTVKIMGNSDRISYQEGIFDISDVFTNEKTISEQLYEMILNDSSVVYESNENKFEYKDELSKDSRRELALKIKNTEETNDQIDENKKYYMLITENGDIVKFLISEDILQVKEKNYKILQPF